MSLFLIVSFPFYLYLTIYRTLGSRARLARAVRACSFGIVVYIPVYILSRLIPEFGFFPWDIVQIFEEQLLRSREAYSRIVAALILLFVILRRYRLMTKQMAKRQAHIRGGLPFRCIAVHSAELLCWLCGYFLAENFHDFLLLGPLPSSRDLFLSPLSRILFSQFVVFAFECLQLVRHPQFDIRARARAGSLLYFALAFLLLSILTSAAVILNIYWIMAFILLVSLLSFFAYAHQFDAIGRRYRSSLY